MKEDARAKLLVIKPATENHIRVEKGTRAVENSAVYELFL